MSAPSTPVVDSRRVNEICNRPANQPSAAASEPDPLGAESWRHLRPNEHGDWIHQRSEGFSKFAPIHDESDPRSLFTVRTSGLKTNRDAWNYNYSRPTLEANAKRMVLFFNAEVDRFAATAPTGTTATRTEAARKFANLDSANFSWDRSDFQRMAKGQKLEIETDAFHEATYRPFQRLYATVARSLNNTIYQLPRLYPRPDTRTLAMWFPPPGSMAPRFSVLMTNSIADNGLFASSATVAVSNTVCLGGPDSMSGPCIFSAPAWTSNVSAGALQAYRTLDQGITADDLFFYVYGILHARDYREAFATDLKKMLPRIPQVRTREDFWAYSNAGRALADLHVGYETVEPWGDLEITYAPGFDPDAPGSWRVDKMRYPKIPDSETGKKIEDKTRILYSRHVTISGVPLRAHDYRLGSRSALDWVLNQYEVVTDAGAGIVNDPNDWAAERGQPTYIFDLIRRVVTVSMRTLDLIESLPALDLS